MTIAEGPSRSNIISRIVNILASPKTEWDVIDAEPATVGGLFLGYIAPLSAIPAVLGFLLTVMLGGLFSFFGVHISPLILLPITIFKFLFQLLGVALGAWLIDALAPTFGGQRNYVQALKVIAYSLTAAWIGKLALIVPLLGFLVALALGIYGLYVMYLGLPKLMKTTQDRAIPYLLTVFVICLVVGAVYSLSVGMVVARLTVGSVVHAVNTNGKISLGGVTVDTAKIEAASKQMEAAARQLEDQANGAAAGGAASTAASGEVLQGLLPANLPGGFARTEIESASTGVAGLNMSTAKGVYNKGDARIRLEVSDIGAAGAMAGAFNIKSSRQSGTRYERVATVNGRMTTEEYDSASKSGKYGVLVGGHFMVQAEGDSVSIDDLKGAVGQVPFGKLEALAKP
ncbi:hypothetical protein BH11PSE2_BH11PSE2_04720 [soil metagenome]